MAEEIRADIVGRVCEIAATEGQVLAEGEPIVILESMKMEIPVVTNTPGTLASLGVFKGDLVKEGDLLAVLE